MKRFALIFSESFYELKSLKTLTTTGILIAAYVVLDAFTISIGEVLKFNFSFLALALIGMLFGPVVSCIAAIPCDLIGCFATGKSIIPVFTIVAIIEAFIYGVVLYKLLPKRSQSGRIFSKENAVNILKLFIARLSVNLICNVLLNTAILRYLGFIKKGGLVIYMTRLGKNIAMLPIEVFLMIVIMLPLSYAFKKATASKKNIQECEQ